MLQRLMAHALFGPTFCWNYLLGRVFRVRHWWDSIDDTVLLGARPLHRDVAVLAEQGVRGVVNMCEEFPGHVREYDALGIEQLWLPTIDFQPPTLELVTQGVEFIQRMAASQHKVYVHCKAGRARSATVVLCWLVKYRGMSPAAAQELLLRCRPHVNRRLTERAVVQQFVAELRMAK